MTGKYACGVSAMGACADYFGVWDWSDFAGDYQRLWDLSGTYDIKNENGIIYGSTSYYNIGPAFKTFCAENGLSISVNATYAPTYSFFIFHYSALQLFHKRNSRNICIIRKIKIHISR